MEPASKTGTVRRTSAGWVGLHALEARLLGLEGHEGTHAPALACILPCTPDGFLHSRPHPLHSLHQSAPLLLCGMLFLTILWHAIHTNLQFTSPACCTVKFCSMQYSINRPHALLYQSAACIVAPALVMCTCAAHVCESCINTCELSDTHSMQYCEYTLQDDDRRLCLYDASEQKSEPPMLLVDSIHPKHG